MKEPSREEFLKMKNEAAEKVREMHRSSMPFPDFVSLPGSKAETEPLKQKPQTEKTQENRSISGILRYLNLPEMMKNSDALLLLGLILLLSNESADERLVLALAYILL